MARVIASPSRLPPYLAARKVRVFAVRDRRGRIVGYRRVVPRLLQHA